MKKIIYVAIIIYCSACVNTKQKIVLSESIDTLSINIQAAARYDLFEIIDTIQLIPLETSETALLGEISKIILSSDTLFIMDQSSKGIFLFSSNGTFIRKLIKTGNGPGEYDNIRDFCIDEKNKNIIILSNSRILKYDFQGNIISAIKLETTGERIELLKNGYLAMYSVVNNLIVLDEKGELMYSCFPDKKLPVPMQPFNQFRDTIYYHNVFDTRVYQIDKTEIVIDKYLNFGNRTPSIELVEKLNMKGNFGQPILPNSYVEISNFFELEQGYVVKFQCNELGASFVGLISKKDRKTRVIKGINQNEIIIPFPEPKFLSQKNDIFINSLSAFDIKSLLNYNKDTQKPKSNKPLKSKDLSIYKSLPKEFNENDNPVLMLFSYKF